MSKNPLALVGAALAAAAITAGVFWALTGGTSNPAAMVPLPPKPGEELRLAAAPKPLVLAAPAQVAQQLEGKAMAPGDQVLAELLRSALKESQAPGYKTSIDAPYQDNAAPALRDEVRRWIAYKMAGMGFAEAEGKPTVSWVVHLDPGEQGRYRLQAILRAGGEKKFEQTFELPAAAAPDRLDLALAAAFSAPQR